MPQTSGTTQFDCYLMCDMVVRKLVMLKIYISNQMFITFTMPKYLYIPKYNCCN